MGNRQAVFAVLCAASCAPSFDGTRTPEGGSFGTRVVELMCKRLAFSAEPTDVEGNHYRDACKSGGMPADAPATLLALDGDRAQLIAAIDATVPATFTDPLQAYLSDDMVLAMYDDGTMSTQVASLADLLDEIGGNGDALAAFARRGTRDHYRPAATDPGAPAALAMSPKLGDLMATSLPALVDGGAAHAQWQVLVAALAATLADADAPADPAAPDRTATLAQQLLLTERPDLGDPDPLLVVRRDLRGIALPAAIAPPLVDGNGDGLADVDALGRFVDASGAPAAVPAPFPAANDSATRDAQGRSPVYAYLDVSKTVLGALAHDAAPLLDPIKGTALDLARGASALLGPRVPAMHVFDSGAMLAYQGYDLTQSPLLDMTYGYMQLLRDPNVRDLLALTDTLLAQHAPAAARLVEAAIVAARAGNNHPDAQIDPHAPLWDDMVPVIRQILARPNLVKALLAAMERPEVAQLAQRFSEEMAYKDRFDIDPTTQAVTGSFTTMPDRTQPDNGYNRSLFERLLQLINDSNGAVSCNKQGAVVKDPILGLPIATYNACQLFRVDNLAVFYVQAIAYAKDAQGRYLCEDSAGAFGNTQPTTDPKTCTTIGTGWRPRPKADFQYNWGAVVSSAIDLQGGDSYMESQAGISGMRTHPTPQALNRVLFLNPLPAFLTNVIDPQKDRDGDLYTSQHAGTLPVWEKNNFYDQIRPIVQAFADDGSEQLFVDLLAVMHEHWPSKDSITTQHTDPTGPNYSWGSNGKSYEPLMIEIFGGDLMPALVATAPELDAITANGKSYATIVTNAATFALTPLPGLADRQGRTTTTTADGVPVTTLSPWHVLADAYVGKTAAIAADGAEGQAWSDSVAEVVDVLLRASNPGTGWTFRNGHVVPVLRAMIAFTRARLDAHDAAGDRTTWLAQTLPGKTRDLFAHPVFAAVADLGVALTADTGARAALDGWLHDALSQPTAPASFAELSCAAADLVQLASDDADVVPLAQLAGSLLAPGKPYLANQLAFATRLRAADPATTLPQLIGQAFAAYGTGDPGTTALGAIVEATGDVDRAPDAGAWTPDDYKTVFSGVAAFLREQQRGLPRFIAIVAGRNP